MRTTVHLPDDLLRRAKQKAASDGRTLTSLIEDGLRIVLAERATEVRRERHVALPVSTASGGLMPGLDPIKFVEQLQEIEDIEYMHRIDRQSR